MSAQGLGINRVFLVTRRGSTSKGCMISALILFMLLMVGAGVGTFLVIKNQKTLKAYAGETIMVAAIEKSSMPESEKAEVKEIISQLRFNYENETVSDNDFKQIMLNLVESPLLPSMIASEAYGKYYDENEEISDENKAAARLQLARVARGVFEETVSNGQLVDVLSPISASSGYPGRTVKIEIGGTRLELKKAEDCTVEELAEVVANAQAASDEKNIPNELFSVDASDEIQRVVDAVMAGDGADLLSTPELTPPDAEDAPDAGDAVEGIEEGSEEAAEDGGP